MTTDLWMMVATGLWGALIPMIYAFGRFQVQGGINWAFGNRETTLDVAPWVARTVRAHGNFNENLGRFIILVLAAHASGKANELTALGASIFFYSRIAHTLIYASGVVYLRTVAFFAGTAGEILILLQLFK